MVREKKEEILEKAGEAKDEILEKAGEAKDEILGKAGEAREDIREKVEDINFNTSCIERDAFMLHGPLADQGYDWWWHSFTGVHEKTGEEKAFFIEFFTVNPSLGGAEPIYGQLPENREKGVKPSYMMVKCGAWGEDHAQLHRFFGWDDVVVKEDVPYHISAGECFCSETRTLGQVCVSEEEAAEHPEWMSDAGRMIWDLQIDKNLTFNVGYGASKAMRDTDAFEMFWHVEGMRTAYTGKVNYNGETYLVSPENCYGYADKNWGHDFTSPWLWIASSNLKSKISGEKLQDSAFVIGGGRPKVGNLALDHKLLGAFWYEGEAYEFNFSKVWTLPRTKFACKENKNKVVWRVEMETPIALMQLSLTCQKKDMLLVNYEAPDGAKKHNHLWNGGNGVGEVKLFRKKISLKNKWEWELIDDIEIRNAGCEYGEYDK